MVKLRTNTRVLVVIEFLELGVTAPNLDNSCTVLSHDISLFLLAVTEVNGVETLCTLEDSVTGNLLIHVF